MGIRRGALAFGLLLTTVLAPYSLPPVHAGDDLIELIPRFYSSRFTLRPNSGMHEGHFTDPFQASLSTVSLLSSIAIQSTNYPIGSSSGGLVYVQDDQGRLVRASDTFGPIISERALTLGKGKMNFGMTYQHSSYNEYNGQDLNDGAFRFVLQHIDNPPTPDLTDPFFEGDVIQTELDLDLSRDESLFFFNYGLTKRIDVGVTIPIVRVDLRGSITGDINRLATDPDPSLFYHAFDAANPPSVGCLVITESRCRGTIDDSKTGIGDIALRGKMNLLQKGTMALGATLDARLATGDEANLLGLGASELEGQFVASWENGAVSPHVNVGYSASFGDYQFTNGAQQFTIEPPSEAAASGGVSWAASDRWTLSSDLVFRRFFDVSTTEVREEAFIYRLESDPQGFTRTAILDQTVPIVEDVNVSIAAFGAKVGVGHGILINVAAIVPFGSGDGLQDTASLLFALDFSR